MFGLLTESIEFCSFLLQLCSISFTKFTFTVNYLSVWKKKIGCTIASSGKVSEKNQLR